uniref:Uncharacterized protein n=1 Tax=Alloyangia mangrovi TaxID=1779329 RepID=A0A2A3JTW5_9RHOB
MKVFFGAALAAVVTVCLPGPAAAQEAERAVLKALLSGDTRNVEVTEEFARAVPEAQLDGLLETLRAQIGPVEEIELEGGSGILRSATYQVPVKITLDPAGRIAGLRLGAPSRWSPTCARRLQDWLDWAPRSPGW